MKTTLTNIMESTASFKNLSVAIGMMVLTPFIFLIIFCIAFIANMLLLRVSGLICVIYLYLYSYFGAYIRGADKENTLSKMFRNINDENPCKPSISNAFTVAISKFINFIFTNLTFVVIICYSILSIMIYLKKITNKFAAGFLIGINGIIIIFAIIASIINSRKTQIDLRDYNYIEPFNQ
jgi:hypothetical protein